MTETTNNKAHKIPRTKADYATKIQKLEEEKQLLVSQRKEEICSIIDKIGCLSIDNELLAGALTILKEIDNSKTQDLPENLKAFELLMREKAPVFFRSKSRVSKS
jgi:hypothetical protein